ncbi:14-3-3 protein beta/alpha-B-like [Teleopsis dalmanni]|uniref:14-3-3 protein beta/alpha-B-like n=1 Tax=Teleopsis dalmanni TaxID=139649 RepID=UPI0018CDB88C|nr:14-3-3 protein beta/alpha-B-like [Teleopsis dalmanni]
MDSKYSKRKNELISKIVVANLIKSYEDMAIAVHDLVQISPGLNEEEMNWLSVAYKHCVNTRIYSWHTVKKALEQEKEANNTINVHKAEEMLKDIEVEIRTYCADILNMLEYKIIKNVADTTLKVSCFKLMGDHNHFLSEIETNERRNYTIQQSHNAYEEGYNLATKTLDVDNPVFLALVLNYSLFLHETVKDAKRAMEIVMTARESIAEMSNVQTNNKSTYILKLLDENMDRWGATENHYQELL